jgi:hypothetical protein
MAVEISIAQLLPLLGIQLQAAFLGRVLVLSGCDDVSYQPSPFDKAQSDPEQGLRVGTPQK